MDEKDKAATDKAAAEKAAAAMHAPIEAQMAMERAAAAAAAAQKAAAAIKKGTVQVKSLYIRKDHTTAAQYTGGLVKGNEVTIYETWTDGKDTWARIGPDQWAAMIFDGETYIKVE